METLKEMMTKKIFTVSVDSTMAEAYQVMTEHRVRHLPVVDQSYGIVGMLSSKDVTAFSRFPNSQVEFFMSSPVISIYEGASVREAVFKLLENKISALLVANDHDQAVGIVTTDDFLWQLAHICAEEEGRLAAVEELLGRDTVGEVAHRLSLAGI